jgi:polyisoprenoid-binding protein YceI
MRPRSPLVVLLLVAVAATAAPLHASPWTVDLERSTFAVLTHKAGIAAGLAHDHLVVARHPACTLDFDPAAPERAQLSVVAQVLALEIDSDAERAKHAERLTLLGALTEPFKKVDDGDRAKIRASMLAPKQLFAERYPEVKAELLALAPRGAGAEGARVALGWDARAKIEVRGIAIEKTLPVRFEVVQGAHGPELHAELLGELRFTEFGIEPYTAVLGAVKVDDLFHLWVELIATPAP